MNAISPVEHIESFENQARFYKRLSEIALDAAEKVRAAAVECGIKVNNKDKDVAKATKRPRNDATLNELILNILDEKKDGLNLPGLLKAVLDSGYKTSSKAGEKGLYQIIYQAVHKMQQSKTVTRDDTKRYRLLA